MHLQAVTIIAIFTSLISYVGGAAVSASTGSASTGRASSGSASTGSASTERYVVVHKGFKNVTFARGTQVIRTLKNLEMSIVDITPAEALSLSSNNSIKIYQDAPVKITAETFEANPSNWGLDRIDQRNLPLDNQYGYCSTGSGVDVFVIDTGVNAGHVEFGGRASFDYNYVGDGINTDCNGHGTHVSSLVAGISVGVAKQVQIHALKVLDCTGSGSFSNVIAAIDNVVGQHSAGNSSKTIINMSLSGGLYQPVNDAVTAAYDAGVTVVVAAGNQADNACSYSPSSATGAIVVGATDITDTFASFSNFASCVNILAPGVSIYGAYIPGNTYATLSGTSMASPMIAGLSALLLATNEEVTPASVLEKLVSVGTSGAVIGVPLGTVNLLAYEDHSSCSSSSSSSSSTSFASSASSASSTSTISTAKTSSAVTTTSAKTASTTSPTRSFSTSTSLSSKYSATTSYSSPTATPLSYCVYNIPSFDGVTKYCVVTASSFAYSESLCSKVGGSLANINSAAEKVYLEGRVQQSSWISAWKGDTYGNNCLIFSTTGAITVATTCAQSLQGLCKIPA